MNVPLRDPERWEELLADEALVGLSDDDRRLLATLASDDVLEREGPLFELAAGELAAAAFDQANGDVELGRMPSAVGSRLAALFDAGAPSPKAVVDAPPRVLPIRRGSFVPWALAAAAIVLAVIGWTRQPPPAPVVTNVAPTAVSERQRLLAIAGTARIDFTPTKDPAAEQASGDVVWHSGLQRGFMRIAGLAPNDPKQAQYQLWVFDAERGDTFPVDGGVFDVTATGEVIVPITAKLDVRKAKLFAITVEKPGGVVVSKRERIVLTAAVSS